MGDIIILPGLASVVALLVLLGRGATMDVHKILQALYEERTRIEQAILALESLDGGRRKRRGRPPKWLVEARRRLGDAGERGRDGDGGSGDR